MLIIDLTAWPSIGHWSHLYCTTIGCCTSSLTAGHRWSVSSAPVEGILDNNIVNCSLNLLACQLLIKSFSQA